MKKINILLAGVGLLFTFSSCNDFLDKLPDDRAEVDDFERLHSWCRQLILMGPLII